MSSSRRDQSSNQNATPKRPTDRAAPSVTAASATAGRLHSIARNTPRRPPSTATSTTPAATTPAPPAKATVSRSTRRAIGPRRSAGDRATSGTTAAGNPSVTSGARIITSPAAEDTAATTAGE